MKIRNIVLSTLVFIGISFGIMFWVTAHAFNVLISTNNEELAQVSAAKIFEELDYLISKPLIISETMANDYTFQQIIEKHDEDEYIRYLCGIQNHFGLFTSYFADDSTLIYHTYSGQTTLVNKEKPSAAWYWKLKESKDKYTISVALNNQKGGIPTIYVNYKVYSNKGKFLGVCGTGVELTDLKTLFYKYKELYDIKVYYTDNGGNIISGFDNQQNEYIVLAQKYFENSDKYVYHQTRKKGFVISRYIGTVDRQLVVVKEEAPKNTNDILMYYKIVSIGIVILVLVVVLVVFMLLEQKTLKKQSVTDKMTGLLNKAGFMEAVTHLLNTTESGNFAFMFLDLDNFKMINDQLGHAAGDKAIVDAGKTVRASLRSNDIIGRFGGDEFVACIKDVGEDELKLLLNELLENLKCTYSDGKRNVKVTTSIGVVYTSDKKEIDLNEVLKLADETMYEVKTNGKNSYCIKNI